MIKINVKHINPSWVKNFGCNSERIESALCEAQGDFSRAADATQKELKDRLERQLAPTPTTS
ncbi:hypothetical protein [Thermofilum sp.]|uniref:hypothetical protein n=1 Tax=Thermofilum sp. TaxID=1961369 RepID=UPI0031742630